MKDKADYKELLKREGLKNTKHRNSVLDILENSEQPVTAECIFLKLKEENVSINLSTVYRVLEKLYEKRLINKTNITDESKALYEINHMEHKHHLVCVGCKKMFSVDECPIEEYEKTLQKKLGFDITGHKLEIYGYCRDCKAVE